MSNLRFAQCRAESRVWLSSTAKNPHECELEESHYMPHRCWCGIGFWPSRDGFVDTVVLAEGDLWHVGSARQNAQRGLK